MGLTSSTPIPEGTYQPYGNYPTQTYTDTTYQPKGNYPTQTYCDTTYQPVGNYPTKTYCDTTYLSNANAVKNYQPVGNYPTKTYTDTTYLSIANAVKNYQPVGNYISTDDINFNLIVIFNDGERTKKGLMSVFSKSALSPISSNIILPTHKEQRQALPLLLQSIYHPDNIIIFKTFGVESKSNIDDMLELLKCKYDINTKLITLINSEILSSPMCLSDGGSIGSNFATIAIDENNDKTYYKADERSAIYKFVPCNPLDINQQFIFEDNKLKMANKQNSYATVVIRIGINNEYETVLINAPYDNKVFGQNIIRSNLFGLDTITADSTYVSKIDFNKLSSKLNNLLPTLKSDYL